MHGKAGERNADEGNLLSFLTGRGLLECLASYTALRLPVPPAVAVTVAVFYSDKRSNIYDILWALVFGFATLNILGLIARRFEPTRNRMNFGELMAVMTVVVSVFLLGWEMLTVFKVLPIHLSR